MTRFGQACHVCRDRPAIRVDGLCAGCGETHDIALRLIEAEKWPPFTEPHKTFVVSSKSWSGGPNTG